MRSPLILALSNSSFSFLLISEFFSQFAINLLNFVLLLVVFNLSSSNTAVAGVVLSFTLPSIFFGIIAGIYVDKWNKRNVLVLANVFRALAAFPLIFISTNLFVIYLLSFTVSLITQFFIPAETPIIPLLVEKKLLLSANALFSMGIFGSIIIAYAMSGPLLFFLGKTMVFYVITAFFVFSAIFAFLVRLKIVTPQHEEKTDFVYEFKDTISVMLKAEKVYHSLFLLTILYTLILVIAVIGPGYATNILNIEVEKFPILFVTPAVIGMGIGALVIGNFLHKKSKQMLAKIGLLITGIAVLLFPYGSVITSRDFVRHLNSVLPSKLDITNVHIMVFMAVIIGFAFSLVFVPSNTILQEETTDNQRGKIYGSLNTLVGIASIGPILGVGYAADVFGVGKVLTAIGIFIIGISMLRLFKFK